MTQLASPHITTMNLNNLASERYRPAAEKRAWLLALLSWIRSGYGDSNIIHGVICGETAEPYLQLTFAPIPLDGPIPENTVLSVSRVKSAVRDFLARHEGLSVDGYSKHDEPGSSPMTDGPYEARHYHRLGHDYEAAYERLHKKLRVVTAENTGVSNVAYQRQHVLDEFGGDLTKLRGKLWGAAMALTAKQASLASRMNQLRQREVQLDQYQAALAQLKLEQR